MVTQDEQDERDERKRARASTKIEIQETQVGVVTWRKHVRPERAAYEQEQAEEE